jgi:hypothetical protein
MSQQNNRASRMNRGWALVVRGLAFGQVYDLRVVRIRLDRLNALMGTFLSLIPLAGGDDLAVGRLEVESATVIDGSGPPRSQAARRRAQALAQREQCVVDVATAFERQVRGADSGHKF